MRRILVLIVLFATACVTTADDSSDSNPGGKADGNCSRGEPGEVDSCFGTSGLVRPVLDVKQVLFAATTAQPDGKLLLLGYGLDRAGVERSFLLRFHRDGTPDREFRADLAVAPGYFFRGTSLATRPDGRIIVTGQSGNEWGASFAVLYLAADGSRDPMLPSGAMSVPNHNESVGQKILLEDNGTFSIAGTARCSIVHTCDSRSMFVARFDAEGNLEPSCGDRGFAFVSAGPQTRLDDAISLGAATFLLGSVSEPRFGNGTHYTFSQVVLGAVDVAGHALSGFGTDGTVYWYNPLSNYVGTRGEQLRVGADGKLVILAAGGRINSLFTVESDGRQSAITDYYNGVYLRRSVFQSDGAVFAIEPEWPRPNFLRYLADGTLDRSFKTDLTPLHLSEDSSFLLGETSAVDAGDAWLVTAHIYTQSTGVGDVIVFKLWK